MIEVRVYGPSGTGAHTVLPRRRNARWQEDLDAVGFGSFQVHALDAALTAGLLDHGRIVKFWYEGAERFAFRIERRETQVVSTDEDAGRWITVSGRGLLSLLGDCPVYPEYGLTRTSGDERRFSWASKPGDWYVPAEWTAPAGVRQDADSTARANNPADWPDGAAQWIWPTSPTAPLSGDEVVFFRTTLVVGTPQAYKIYATADNALELYLDGEPILQSDPADMFAWRTTQVFTVDLAAGSHILAARVENLANKDGAFNPAGLLCTVATVNAKGEPVQFVRRTDPTNWLCHTGNPGWRAAHILQTLLSEAQALDYTAADYLTTDFTGIVDSTGVAWTDRQDLAVRVAFESALDVATKLAEAAIDLAVSPSMVLQAWKKRGTNKSATVALSKGVSLVDHKVTSTAATATRFLARAGQGWVEVVNTTAETAHGRRGAGLQLGGAQSIATAQGIANAVFAETATPQVIVESGSMPARPGATPYVDFGVGDDVTTLGEGGASIVVRVSSLSVTEDEVGNVVFTPELYL